MTMTKAILYTALVAMVATSSASRAASAASDNAGSYTALTFTNGSNEGTGFGAWAFNLGVGASATLADSTSGSGDINSTNGLSFRFDGGITNNYVDAFRPFNAALNVGDIVSVRLAYNWSDGNRGVNLLSSSDQQLLNVNFGGASQLAYEFQGEAQVTVSSDYISTAVVEVVVTQLPGNQLGLTLTRNDGFTTTVVSTAVSAPAAKFKFYNGGHNGSSTNMSLFVNDLAIVPNPAPTLTLSGRDAMAEGMTNLVTVTRGGAGVGSPLTVTLSSSDASATVPASVTFNAGDAVTNFPVVGAGLGTAVISATAASNPTDTLSVAVYDIGYDDSSYYPPGSFSNGGNGGLGWTTWLFQGNDGAGDGYTNFAGSFIGESTGSGGGNVNASSGDAFGIYANGSGSTSNAPFFNAIRGFASELGIGEVVSLKFGVNYRSGAKGVVFQRSGSPIFEVATIGDDYVYRDYVSGTGFVSLGWAYAADTAFNVEFIRTSTNTYNVSVNRTGSAPQTNALGSFNLGVSAANEVRFYVYSTDAGGENNLFFNRLAIYTDAGSVLTDGIPNSWWDRYGIAIGDRSSTNNPDGDYANNLQEYIADSNPTDITSFFPNVITNAAGQGVTTFVVGPTTNSRVYDVWWSTNLVASPQTWTRYGLSVPGNPAGGSVSLQVTNNGATHRAYRTGVTLP